MGKRVGSWRHWPRRLEALNNFHSGRLFLKHTDDLEVNVERNNYTCSFSMYLCIEKVSKCKLKSW
jgi:hypothetical protein